jgi:hypothetical protein
MANDVLCPVLRCIVSCAQDDVVRKVGLSRYSKVSRTAFGLQGKQRIAVLRCGGAILGEWTGCLGGMLPCGRADWLIGPAGISTGFGSLCSDCVVLQLS